MDFVEYIRISKECTQARLCAQQDHPSAIFGAGIVGRVSVAEDASAQGDELFAPYFLDQSCVLLIDHSNKHFKSAYMQFL